MFVCAFIYKVMHLSKIKYRSMYEHNVTKNLIYSISDVENYIKISELKSSKNLPPLLVQRSTIQDVHAYFKVFILI